MIIKMLVNNFLSDYFKRSKLSSDLNSDLKKKRKNILSLKSESEVSVTSVHKRLEAKLLY